MDKKIIVLKCPKCGKKLYSGNGTISYNGETGIKAMIKAIRCKDCGCHPVEESDEKKDI